MAALIENMLLLNPDNLAFLFYSALVIY